MFKADKCLRTPSVCLIVPIVVYFLWLQKPALNRLWGCWFISCKWRMPHVQQIYTRCSMLSSLTSVHLCLLSTQLVFFYHPFDYHKGGGSSEWYPLFWISLTPSTSFSPSYFSLLLLVLLSSGFRRLSTSLVPRSTSPLPLICQPFDLVPA